MKVTEVIKSIDYELDKFQYYDTILTKFFVRELLEDIRAKLTKVDNPFEKMWIELYFELLEQDKEKDLNVGYLEERMREIDRKYTIEGYENEK